jgi:hypothetical protein
MQSAIGNAGLLQSSVGNSPVVAGTKAVKDRVPSRRAANIAGIVKRKI